MSPLDLAPTSALSLYISAISPPYLRHISAVSRRRALAAHPEARPQQRRALLPARRAHRASNPRAPHKPNPKPNPNPNPNLALALTLTKPNPDPNPNPLTLTSCT